MFARWSCAACILEYISVLLTVILVSERLAVKWLTVSLYTYTTMYTHRVCRHFALFDFVSIAKSTYSQSRLHVFDCVCVVCCTARSLCIHLYLRDAQIHSQRAARHSRIARKQRTSTRSSHHIQCSRGVVTDLHYTLGRPRRRDDGVCVYVCFNGIDG